VARRRGEFEGGVPVGESLAPGDVDDRYRIR
jgi:hypothetical protein